MYRRKVQAKFDQQVVTKSEENLTLVKGVLVVIVLYNTSFDIR